MWHYGYIYTGQPRYQAISNKTRAKKIMIKAAAATTSFSALDQKMGSLFSNQKTQFFTSSSSYLCFWSKTSKGKPHLSTFPFQMQLTRSQMTHWCQCIMLLLMLCGTVGSDAAVIVLVSFSETQRFVACLNRVNSCWQFPFPLSNQRLPTRRILIA